MNLIGSILLGLLSRATLPLRRKAAEEGSLPSLKLITMGAIIRYEDFNNCRLLMSYPIVVKVPGPNFLVAVHYSKVPCLDDYG
jgi:HrpA-like RNA helicase